MALGEKLWEEKGTATGMSIKSADANGVTIEFSIAAQLQVKPEASNLFSGLQENLVRMV
jgi:hypothetical protein